MKEYIERESLLKTFGDILKYQEEQDYWWQTTTTKIAINKICNAPTEDVAPVVHGEWIHSSRGFDVEGDYECSLCHSPSGIKHFYNGEKYAYCPDCGARMDADSKNKREEIGFYIDPKKFNASARAMGGGK